MVLSRNTSYRDNPDYIQYIIDNQPAAIHVTPMKGKNRDRSGLYVVEGYDTSLVPGLPLPYGEQSLEAYGKGELAKPGERRVKNVREKGGGKFSDRERYALDLWERYGDTLQMDERRSAEAYGYNKLKGKQTHHTIPIEHGARIMQVLNDAGIDGPVVEELAARGQMLGDGKLNLTAAEGDFAPGRADFAPYVRERNYNRHDSIHHKIVDVMGAYGLPNPRLKKGPTMEAYMSALETPHQKQAFAVANAAGARLAQQQEMLQSGSPASQQAMWDTEMRLATDVDQAKRPMTQESIDIFNDVMSKYRSRRRR